MPQIAIITGGGEYSRLTLYQICQTNIQKSVGMFIGHRCRCRVVRGLLTGGKDLHLLDVNEERGTAVASSLKGAHFHKTDVTSYASLSQVFENVHKSEGRLDFVFANAGIVERWNFYEEHTTSPPPEPDQLSIDIDLKSVVSTTYLAQHYFRLSKPSYRSGNQSLVMTASCGGLYPSPFCPMYTAAKHGVIGLTRAVAKHFYFKDKIRTSCICPGTVRTNLLDAEGWSQFPDSYFTPVSKIVEVVLTLVDGGNLTDSKGKVVQKGQDWGLAAEINGVNHYFRDQPEWCDKAMEEVMKATDVVETNNYKIGA
jgi:NAD(P)-dependent dehydrogenase (short-subunit alcohol dehydrogenase family)